MRQTVLLEMSTSRSKLDMAAHSLGYSNLKKEQKEVFISGSDNLLKVWSTVEPLLKDPLAKGRRINRPGTVH